MGPPANYPNFWNLVDHVAAGTGLVRGEDETPDRFLGRLAHRGVQVHQRAADKLSDPTARPTTLHVDLLRLFGEPAAARLVTTNFDLLFEMAAQEIWGSVPTVYKAPALPLGRDFDGIVHVHGALPRASSLVLTDSDFGRAYLTEGWARRFLVEAFQEFAVLFVGYSYQDVVLRYLARALPGEGRDRRFALDRASADARAWDYYGITFISFPMLTQDDYSSLVDGVSRLATFCRRDVLDWREQISKAAQELPPSDIEFADLLRHALNDLVLSRFFVDACRHAEWIAWLDDNGILTPLFEANPLDKRCELLAHWIAAEFAIPHANEVFLLIGRHQLRLNPQFWWHLARHLAADKSQNLQAPILAKWVSLLLYSVPKQLDDFVVQWLSERCARQGLYSISLQLFEVLLDETLLLRKTSGWFGEAEDPDKVVRLEITLGEHWTMNEVWTKHLKPHLSAIADLALPIAIEKLRSRRALRLLWDPDNEHWDSDSYHRSAIEPHGQDKYPEALDVVIDVARDALEWMAQHHPAENSAWCERLINSDAALLRRLAIHALRSDTVLTPDQKIGWMLSRSIHDYHIRHETFMLLKETYQHVSGELRVSVVDAIGAYKARNDTDPDRERHEAIEKYQWFHWLAQTDPNCSVASSALAKIQAAYPEIRARDHPDLTHWHGDAEWSGSRSPWTVDELLGRDAKQWRHELVSFVEQDPLGPDRRGLSEAIREAAQQRPRWGLELADSLADNGEWESDVWDALFRAWSNWPDEQLIAESFVAWACRPELAGAHARSAADLLYALVKDGGRPYAPALLERGNSAAKNIWLAVDRDDPGLENHDDWLQSAINNAAGIVAEYWINSLSVAINKAGWPTQGGLSEAYLDAFDLMASDETSAGYYARTIIASQFAFVLGLDEDWIRQKFIGRFTDENALSFQHVWHGLLWSRLNHAALTMLTPSIYSALPRLEQELLSRLDRFVEFYVTLVSWHADDPVGSEIPQFFQGSSPTTRKSFAAHVGMLLRGLDPSQQLVAWDKWLSAYWRGRNQGAPLPLDDGEVECMIDWPLRLRAVFSDAVNLAIRMPPSNLEHSLLVHELSDSALVETYSESVAELVAFFLSCNGPQWLLHGIEDLLRKLAQQVLSPGVRQKLRERAALKGIDAVALGL